MKEQARGILEPIKFCQKPSKQYLKMLEDCGGDPRSVTGLYMVNKAGILVEKGWIPTWDARDIRTNYPDGWKIKPDLTK